MSAKQTHDPSKAREATCRELAEAYHETVGDGRTSWPPKLRDGLAAYRAECAVAPLRTRPDVDAEIAEIVTPCAIEGCKIILAPHEMTRFGLLCAEPTREPDPPAPSARLTEAEAALCDFANSAEPEWHTGDLRNDGRIRSVVVQLLNAVRDERRAAPVKGARFQQLVDQVGDVNATVLASSAPEPTETDRLRGLLRRVRDERRKLALEPGYDRLHFVQAVENIIWEAGEL